MKRFQVEDLSLSGLKMITRVKLEDDRGFLSKIFSEEELKLVGWHGSIKQVNHTHTRHKGTIRGMHFQYAPFMEMKLVSCLHGEIWDVAVDLRKDSPTFLQWEAIHLSAENLTALLIPEGFAHGFQTLTDDCHLVYLHSENYHAASEGAVRFNDPLLGIKWPLALTNISDRDKSHQLITSDFKGIISL